MTMLFDFNVVYSIVIVLSFMFAYAWLLNIVLIWFCFGFGFVYNVWSLELFNSVVGFMCSCFAARF